ncbi:uncharacterized protein [Mytilus edulis]|uniref:uncharacterized protein isoform X2 n=1 Tax=Mytilus edulis TaxID=6550 RepID=UPI0039EFA426
MEENVTIVAYGELIKNVDPNCELLFQRCWSVSWFNDHNFGWELLKSRATTARDFLPRPQPTAFRVLANATSRLLLTFKTAADARPKALREKFLFFDAEKNFTELFEKVYRRNSYCNTSGI